MGLSLWLALWLANGLATLVENKLEKIDFSGPATRVLGAKLIRLLLITFAKQYEAYHQLSYEGILFTQATHGK